MPFQPFWTLIIIIWNITDLATISCPLQLIILHLLISHILFFFQAKFLHFNSSLSEPISHLILLSLKPRKIFVSIITQNCWQWGSNTLVYFAPLTLTPLSATYTFTHKKKEAKGLNPRVARNMDDGSRAQKGRKRKHVYVQEGVTRKRKHISLIMINNHLLASINSQ